MCKCCGIRAIHVDCPAVKVWEFPRNSNLVIILHTGNDTCVGQTLQGWKQCSMKIQTQAACKSAVNAMKAKSFEEVIKITYTFINTNAVRNAKQKICIKMNPSGVNFEAVGQLKAKVDRQDPYQKNCPK